MTSLRTLVIDLPRLSRDCRELETNAYANPAVKDLVVRCPEPQECLDEFLYQLSSVLTNLTNLTLVHYCGAWDPEIFEYQLKLPRLSIEMLNLDITPALTTIKPAKGMFFVLEIDIFSKSRRLFYKVSRGLCSVTRVYYNGDMDGFVRGIDYYRFNICINRLDHLKIQSPSNSLFIMEENFNVNHLSIF